MTKAELIEIIEQLTGKKISSLINSQIDKFVKSGMSYKEIARAIVYFYDVKQQDTSKMDKFGIAIVKTIKDEANKYYDNIKIKMDTMVNAAQEAKQVEIKTVKIKPQRRIFNKKGIDIDEL